MQSISSMNLQSSAKSLNMNSSKKKRVIEKRTQEQEIRTNRFEPEVITVLQHYRNITKENNSPQSPNSQARTFSDALRETAVSPKNAEQY